MFDRICGRRILRAGRRNAAGMARRHVPAWLAILGLYVQLFAAGLCTAGTPLDPALGTQGALPICHTGSDQSAPAQDRAPADHACPFCALHCQAAMVMAPSFGAPERFVVVSAQAAQPPFIVPSPARFPAGAPPRGPPASV